MIHFGLSRKNYNDLSSKHMNPRILVVVLVPRPGNPDATGWIEFGSDYMLLRKRAYWVSLAGLPRDDTRDDITVKVPTHQEFNVSTVHELMRKCALGEKI